MKKKLICLMALLFTMVLGGSLASCGGDDGDEANESGGKAGASFTLVGKSFYKSETSYTDIGEKEVNRTTVYFQTETICILHLWGSWENIYSDGSMDKNKYDTGEMTCTYSISGSEVIVRHEDDEWHYTIVNGGLEGFRMSSDGANNTDEGGATANPEGTPGTSDMFGYYTNGSLRSVVQSHAEDLVRTGDATRQNWEVNYNSSYGLRVVDANVVYLVQEYVTLTKPGSNVVAYATDTYTVKTSTYTYYYCLESTPALWTGKYAMNGNQMNIVTDEPASYSLTRQGNTILWGGAVYTKVQ